MLFSFCSFKDSGRTLCVVVLSFLVHENSGHQLRISAWLEGGMWTTGKKKTVSLSVFSRLQRGNPGDGPDQMLLQWARPACNFITMLIPHVAGGVSRSWKMEAWLVFSHSSSIMYCSTSPHEVPPGEDPSSHQDQYRWHTELILGGYSYYWAMWPGFQRSGPCTVEVGGSEELTDVVVEFGALVMPPLHCCKSQNCPRLSLTETADLSWFIFDSIQPVIRGGNNGHIVCAPPPKKKAETMWRCSKETATWVKLMHLYFMPLHFIRKDRFSFPFSKIKYPSNISLSRILPFR